MIDFFVYVYMIESIRLISRGNSKKKKKKIFFFKGALILPSIEM